MAFDPHYAKVTLLLHGNGTNGSAVLVDSSASPKTINAINGAAISTAQSKFGGSSILFDGTDDFLTAVDASAFDFGAGDFAVEAWVYLSAAPAVAAEVVGTNRATAPQNGWYLRIGSDMKVQAGVSIDGTAVLTATTGGSVTVGQWAHIAATRNGGTLRAFVNGISSASTAASGSVYVTGTGVRIGQNSATSSMRFPGYMDEVRITKGEARYTGDFAPPTSAFADTDVPSTSIYSAAPTPLGAPQSVAISKGMPAVHASATTPLGMHGVSVVALRAGDAGAYAADSLKTGAFGIPTASVYTGPVVHHTASVSPLNSTRFGMPEAEPGALEVGAVSIDPPTAFGTPTSGAAHQAQVIAPSAAFGLASVEAAAHAAWFCSTAFGMPIAGRALYAQGVGLGARWGSPTATTHFANAADPASVGARFGTAGIDLSYRASTLAPAARFGKPLIQRGNLC